MKNALKTSAWRPGANTTHSRSADLIGALASARHYADYLIRVTDRALDGDVDRAVYLVGDISRNVDRARAFARDQALARDVDRALTFADEFVNDLGRGFIHHSDLRRARRLYRMIDRVSVNDRGQSKTRRITLPAASLLAAAVRLLPAADRARYADEYRSELWELAQSGNGRLRQLQYALRQLCSAPAMGVALRWPRRRSAAP